MPPTPAQAHLQAKSADSIVQMPEDNPLLDANTPEAREYRLLLQSLGEHLRKIESLPADTAARTAYKTQIMPEFAHHVFATGAAIIANKKAVHDEIYSYYMVWSLDVDDLEIALRLAKVALTYDMGTPARFKSTVQSFFTDEIAKKADIALTKNQPFDKKYLNEIINLIADKEMAGQKRAKLFVALGKLYLRDARALKTVDKKADDEAPARAAYENLKAAYELDNNVAIKAELSRLSKRFNPLTPELSPA